MTITTKSPKLLDDKECFFLWVELGSNAKVASHLKTQGRVNPNTGKAFTPMAVWDSAMRWVLDNPDEARQIYLDHGSPMSQVEWEIWLVLKAMHVLGTSRKRFMTWIRKNQFEKYDYIYRDKYPSFSVQK